MRLISLPVNKTAPLKRLNRFTLHLHFKGLNYSNKADKTHSTRRTQTKMAVNSLIFAGLCLSQDACACNLRILNMSSLAYLSRFSVYNFNTVRVNEKSLRFRKYPDTCRRGLTMVSVRHVYCRQIACFYCVCMSHWGCLIWLKFVKISKQKLKASLPSSTRALFSDKARCFSQSERDSYGHLVTINK